MGLDISQKQLDHAKALLSENGYAAKLICSPMKQVDIPKDYFDFATPYGIGWTTDLQGTFRKIASYLKKTASLSSAGTIPKLLCGMVLRGTQGNIGKR
ncbi:MAG: class I SAM-dependent methyltransferase [Eisenbergiella sp.]